MGFTRAGRGVLRCLDLPMQAVQEGRSEMQAPQWDEHLHPDAQALSSLAKPWTKAKIMPRAGLERQVWRSPRCEVGAGYHSHQLGPPGGGGGTSQWEQDELARREKLPSAG